jgi:hypothetical protein
MKILADDGTEFDSVESCLAHEATLPYLKLLAEVEAACAQDAAFAAKIEAMAGKLRKERYDRGEHKFRRKAKDEAPPTAPDPDAAPRSASETEAAA